MSWIWIAAVGSAAVQLERIAVQLERIADMMSDKHQIDFPELPEEL